MIRPVEKSSRSSQRGEGGNCFRVRPHTGNVGKKNDAGDELAPLIKAIRDALEPFASEAAQSTRFPNFNHRNSSLWVETALVEEKIREEEGRVSQK